MRLLSFILFFSLVLADPPDWVDTPAAYQFTSVMNAQVLTDNLPIAAADDLLAAFDAAGNVRGIGTQIVPDFGPYNGQILYELMLRSNDVGDVLSFKYYDASADEVLYSGASYTFEINALAGTLLDPYFLHVYESPFNFEQSTMQAFYYFISVMYLDTSQYNYIERISRIHRDILSFRAK